MIFPPILGFLMHVAVLNVGCRHRTSFHDENKEETFPSSGELVLFIGRGGREVHDSCRCQFLNFITFNELATNPTKVTNSADPGWKQPC